MVKFVQELNDDTNYKLVWIITQARKELKKDNIDAMLTKQQVIEDIIDYFLEINNGMQLQRIINLRKNKLKLI